MPQDCHLRSASHAQLEIRQARSTDIEALARLEARVFSSDHLSRRSLAALAKSASACLLVAHRGERLIGYAVVLTRRGSRTARLYSIAVEERGRGTGLSLLAAAEAAARTRGAERIRLEVRLDNPAAARFYERAGYKPFGHRFNFYEDGMAANLYVRDLAVDSQFRNSPPLRSTG
jgi:ribosomal protein S18 acetylase RimI-like enzyme